jgi:Holliday junction DNA helicase RuvA
MIGKLTGRVDSHDEDHLILDVSGVGYVVFCSGKTLAMMPPVGGSASLLTETHVREDHIHLYGFATKEEREWFRTLTTVQGVGVKMALNILSVFAPAELATSIAAQDKKALTSVSGVGPKLAERIVTELKNKVAKLPTGSFIAPAHSGTAKTKTAAPGASLLEDAVSALTHLGYQRTEAFAAAARVLQEAPETKLDVLITTSLRQLAA